MRELAKLPTEAWLRQRFGELGLAMGLGLAFAYIGPFSTDRSEFLPKLGYWAGLIACWFVIAALVEQALRNVRIFRNAGLWGKRACLIAATSAPMLLVVAPATTALIGWQASVLEVLEMYYQIAVIGAGVVIIADSVLGTPASSEPERVPEPFSLIEAPAPAAPAPIALPAETAARLPEPDERLMDRLPPHLRGPVLCLQMEDHYVRVHTSKGSALLLMRLGDAIKELGATPGAQAHRSWWVAANAIEAFERSGRAGRLRLTNGLVAPVSQRHMRSIWDLAEAGGIAGGPNEMARSTGVEPVSPA